MKKWFILFVLSISSFAFSSNNSAIFPNVYSTGFNVQVSIRNHTPKFVRCSGFVYLSYQSGQRDSEYFFDNIPANFNSFRTIYPRRMNDRILSVNHSIFCN
jgi:hypothetical protein